MPDSLPVRRSQPFHRWMQLICLLLFGWLFFVTAWPYDSRAGKGGLTQGEFLPPQLFLWLNPLSGIAAAMAGRTWPACLAGALLVLAVCLWAPRFFCSHVCPLGTFHDLFDAFIGRRHRKWNIHRMGSWRFTRFFLLGVILVAAAGGVMLAGYLAAIPLATRGLMFSVGWLQAGLGKNWNLAGPFNPAMALSLVCFVVVMLTGFLGRRFWCRYLCPTGALISIPGLWSSRHREVGSTCSQCGICKTKCAFDAIDDTLQSRGLDCATCSSCVSTCPSQAICFQKKETRKDCPSASHNPLPFSRRAWLGTLLAGTASAVGMQSGGSVVTRPLRPPGSVNEDLFLTLCVRCGECFKVCPGAALQPAGLATGAAFLWTPVLTPVQAGCHAQCYACTRVCPTGAIQSLTLQEKRRFVIGIARIDSALCLPLRGERDCQLCYDECHAAGYHAIEMKPMKLSLGDDIPGHALDPSEIEAMATIKVPVVLNDHCVGCGLCEYRCHARVHSQQKLIARRAIRVEPFLDGSTNR